MKTCFYRLAAVAFGVAMSANSSGAVVTKNSGATTPDATDFTATYNNHPSQAGYNDPTPNKMFRESFRLQCPQGEEVKDGTLSLVLHKNQAGASNDGLTIWMDPTHTFTRHIWNDLPSSAMDRTLSIALGSLPAVGGVVVGNTIGANALTATSGTTFSFSVQDDTMVRQATLEYNCGPAKKGMTWTPYSPPQHPNGVSGTAAVGCQGQVGAGAAACNAYQGDQLCSVALPVLCIRKIGAPDPSADTVNNANTYNSNGLHWSGGIIGTTHPRTGASFATVAAVNDFCAAEFGKDWNVAEHHDAGGWSIRAYGGVGNPKGRFWVHINNQPANCWSN